MADDDKVMCFMSGNGYGFIYVSNYYYLPSNVNIIYIKEVAS